MTRTHWKLALICVGIASGIALLGRAQEPAALPQVQGRFQIFQMQYNAFADGTVIKDVAVFKLDTLTGDTWKYVTGIQDGQRYSRWDKIDERASGPMPTNSVQPATPSRQLPSLLSTNQ